MQRRRFLKLLGLAPAAAFITACFRDEEPLFQLDQPLPEETPVSMGADFGSGQTIMYAVYHDAEGQVLWWTPRT